MQSVDGGGGGDKPNIYIQVSIGLQWQPINLGLWISLF